MIEVKENYKTVIRLYFKLFLRVKDFKELGDDLFSFENKDGNTRVVKCVGSPAHSKYGIPLDAFKGDGFDYIAVIFPYMRDTLANFIVIEPDKFTKWANKNKDLYTKVKYGDAGYVLIKDGTEVNNFSIYVENLKDGI